MMKGQTATTRKGIEGFEIRSRCSSHCRLPRPTGDAQRSDHGMQLPGVNLESEIYKINNRADLIRVTGFLTGHHCDTNIRIGNYLSTAGTFALDVWSGWIQGQCACGGLANRGRTYLYADGGGRGEQGHPRLLRVVDERPARSTSRSSTSSSLDRYRTTRSPSQPPQSIRTTTRVFSPAR